MSNVPPRRAIAHVREFLGDSLTPLTVYRRLAKTSNERFLFESVEGGEQVSRFSFVGAGPREIVRVFEWGLEIVHQKKSHRQQGDALELLRRHVGSIKGAGGSVPFVGGWVGFFGFDSVRLVETLSAPPPNTFGLPLAMLGRFDNLVVFDHAHQRVLAIANEIEGEVSKNEAEEVLDRLSTLLTRRGGGGAVAMPATAPKPVLASKPSLDGDAYRAAVVRAKEYIRAGDIFQVVLARRWQVPCSVPPLAVYRALRMVNPSPYMVLLESPRVQLVGASPEMLVRKTGKRLETRPIAGTRPRGVDPDGDRRLAADLLADNKERAEHVMLVDLGRNDLGRVAAPGSVDVSNFMEVERYSHVMHLVSSVKADIAPGRDALDALLACFPAGTVSGAPKIRAIQIIDELEPERRGPYAGAVGYLSFSGDLDTCITIRTLVMQDGMASVTAGAGIVADSDPAREEKETESKAAALLQAVALAESLSTEEARG